MGEPAKTLLNYGGKAEPQNGQPKLAGNYYRILPGYARAYLHERSELAYGHSSFDCCAKLKCVACCTENLDRDVTAFDLLAMALVSRQLPSTFLGQLTLKADILENFGNIKPRLCLRSPCGFLDDGLCSIHGDNVIGKYAGKPMVCMLFPEDGLAREQLFGEAAKPPADEPFLERYARDASKYLCLAQKPVVGENRFKVILGLERMSDREQGISDIYLGLLPFPLPEELMQSLDNTAKSGDESFPKLYLADAMKIFKKELGEGTQFHARVEEKISALDGREGIKELFRMLDGR